MDTRKMRVETRQQQTNWTGEGRGGGEKNENNPRALTVQNLYIYFANARKLVILNELAEQTNRNKTQLEREPKNI